MSAAHSLREQRDRRFCSAGLYDEFTEFCRHQGGLGLVSPGQKDAAAQETHGCDELREVRPRFRDRHLHALGVHEIDSNKSIVCTLRRLVQFRGESALTDGAPGRGMRVPIRRSVGEFE